MGGGKMSNIQLPISNVQVQTYICGMAAVMQITQQDAQFVYLVHFAVE
jgi:hypothetical protein